MSHNPTSPEGKKAPASRGEKIFDWLVYGGIAGLGTFIVTIPMTYWAKYGSGSGYFKSASKWFQSKGFSPQTAEDLSMTSSLMQGGNLMVLPVKIAEDNKVAIVTKINDMLGEKTDVSALEAEDRQSWGSIIKARLMAWAVVFTSLRTAGHMLGNERFEAFNESFSKNLICKPLGVATHIAGQETKTFKVGKIAALDLFATAAASTLLYIGTRVFAHWERQRKEAKECLKEAATPAAPVETPKQLSTDSTPAAITDIIKAKDTSKGFASAALASRTGEQLQMGV